MQLTAAAVTGNAKGLGGSFLKQLGFEKTGVSTGFFSKDADDCAFTWGKKTLNDGNRTATLVAIVVQSFSFDPAIKA